jgi:parallel beta-helix repeat protein
MINKLACVLGLALVAALMSTAAQADIIFVDDDNCPGPGSGTEGDPYCSIQTAIDNAVDTDEVIVAPGTYFETIRFYGKAITVRSSEEPEVTIIDAQGADTAVTCFDGEGPDTVLNGFTITNGDASLGGGMLNRAYVTPTVINCTFEGNTAYAGGGMYNYTSSPTIIHCRFVGNDATLGGGMRNYHSSPTVSSCTFRANTAEGGGGMECFASSPIVMDCDFRENAAGVGAGIYDPYGGHMTVVNCTFTDNTASSGGGGIFTADYGGPTVIGCTFSGNHATQGGAIRCNENDPTVVNCVFSGNTAEWGGAIGNTWRCSPTIVNCTFNGNVALPLEGGGIRNFKCSPTVTNCVLWGDTGSEIVNIECSLAITYSNVQGGWPGTGNIATDPMFVDPDNGDLRLSTGSPCIDAGHNWAIAGLADTDLDGHPRFADGPGADSGCGVPVVVDMGTYEFQGDPFPVQLGDIDGNGAVGVTDSLLILGAWGDCTEDCCLADLDLDGDVGISDFLILLAYWG